MRITIIKREDRLPQYETSIPGKPNPFPADQAVYLLESNDALRIASLAMSLSQSIGFPQMSSRRTGSFAAVFKFNNPLSVDYLK